MSTFIKVDVEVTRDQYCPINDFCIGQGWRKQFCGIFGKPLATKRQGRRIVYFKCQECLEATNRALMNIIE